MDCPKIDMTGKITISDYRHSGDERKGRNRILAECPAISKVERLLTFPTMAVNTLMVK